MCSYLIHHKLPNVDCSRLIYCLWRIYVLDLNQSKKKWCIFFVCYEISDRILFSYVVSHHHRYHCDRKWIFSLLSLLMFAPLQMHAISNDAGRCKVTNIAHIHVDGCACCTTHLCHTDFFDFSFLQTLRLCSPILEPDFHLCFGQTER